MAERESKNPELPTGDIEILAEDLVIYSEAETTINFARTAANPVIPDDIDSYVRHLMEDYHNSVGG